MAVPARQKVATPLYPPLTRQLAKKDSLHTGEMLSSTNSKLTAASPLLSNDSYCTHCLWALVRFNRACRRIESEAERKARTVLRRLSLTGFICMEINIPAISKGQIRLHADSGYLGLLKTYYICMA